MRYLVELALGLSTLPLTTAVHADRGVNEQTPFIGLEEKPSTPYGFWESPITSDWIGTQSNTIEDVFVDKVTQRIYYVERQAEEGGRNVIKDHITNEPVFKGPYDARSRVHEYGGGQSFAHNGTIYFSNYLDGMLYAVKPGETTPIRLTGEQNISNGPRRRYADFDVHPVYPWIIVGVVEEHGETVENLITIIDTETGQESVINTTSSHPSFVRQPDFVDNPRFSPDGKHLVFRAWFHPYMSWEASELWAAEVQVHDRGSRSAAFTVTNLKYIAGDRDKISVNEPVWFNSTALVFTSDANGYNTPWVYNLDLNMGKALIVTGPCLGEDFSAPAFQLGTSSVAVVDDRYVAYAHYRLGRTSFTIIDVLTASLKLQAWTQSLAYSTNFRSVASGKVAFLATWDAGRKEVNTASLITTDPKYPDIPYIEWRLERPEDFTPRPSTEHQSSISRVYISSPAEERYDHIFSTWHAERAFVDPETGDPVYATYYPPTNPDYEGGLPGERPPVVVNVHGRPTDFSHHGLNWEVQFFTSRGFAWVDVNYAGSTRYGRAYRERLLGQWGVVDVRDALTAVREYGALGMLDPSRAMIRGGGPTVLSALAAAPDAFLAGTSIAGVSDLLSLQAKLPKFESHHLVKYVGGSPEEDWRLWWDRSPISRAGDIRAPLLILHGKDDPIVPVGQAIRILETVRNGGGRAELHVFEGEGYEWRQAKSISKALELELELYQTVLNNTV